VGLLLAAHRVPVVVFAPPVTRRSDKGEPIGLPTLYQNARRVIDAQHLAGRLHLLVLKDQDGPPREFTL
jgi:hypothetical protein